MNVHVRVFVWVPFYVTRSASVGAAREEGFGSYGPCAPSSAAVDPLNSAPRLQRPAHSVGKDADPRDTPRAAAGW